MEQSTNREGKPTHYIGIGASAGGLEALQTLITDLPTNTNACFVIVQHLSPDFKSMMLELLSKHTTMDIKNVTHGMLTSGNTIYLIPPKKNMIIVDGELLLSDKVPDSGLDLPIDVFFNSLAKDQGYQAVGIILSGTGSDGSRGIKALKEAGALVIAQRPESAKFDGMPINAINTGIIDLILTPQDMGRELANYIRHPLVANTHDSSSKAGISEAHEDLMSEIFNLLKVKCELDFSNYKISTISRRIERRMTVTQSITLKDYLNLLFIDKKEVEILGNEFLIGVTRFFRNGESFQKLAKEIIPQIVRNSKPKDLIRVWVAACSTGEEAYSISILIANELEKQNLVREVKVFATDVNAKSIGHASIGMYSSDIIHDVPNDLLNEYFVRTANDAYQIKQRIRNMVVFATHDMIVDPPFSNMDLVLCRNVLIYFQQHAQKKVLSSFHFALKKGAFLFLGESENLGELSTHFSTVSDKNKIFQKISDIRLPLHTSPSITNANLLKKVPVPSVDNLMKSYKGYVGTGGAIGFVKEALIEEFVSSCILLNDQLQAIHVYGDLSQFVKRLQPGRISTNISDMVNEDIAMGVSAAIQRAKQSKEEVLYTDLQTMTEGKVLDLELRVKYIKEHDLASSPGYYWLVFNAGKIHATKKRKHIKFDASEESKQRINELELELKYNKEHLQVTVEELETTNEELQSANEELMSANEELQSTNEELQSVNEELYTVNSEYQEKIAEISQANGDVDEILGLSKIGIIFLDENLQIRRFTNVAKDFINLQPTDIQRPLHHLSKKITYENMISDVARVFATGDSHQLEIELENKRLIRIAINRYNYNDVSKTKGVAITFADISKVKYTELGMSVAYKELKRSIHNALEMLDTAPFTDTLNVLILDDNPAYLELLSIKLKSIKKYPVNVVQATSVAQANELVLSKKIDVCISDYYLKNETALDLIKSLQENKLTIPVLVITGEANDDLHPLLLANGALDLIEKDELTPALLERSVRFAVRRNQIDAQLEGLLPQ